MVANAFIEHVLPGRVRVRIPSKRGDVSFFKEVVHELKEHRNVETVSANPTTGSVVIHHSGPTKDLFDLAFVLFRFTVEPGEPGETAREVSAQLGVPLPEILDGTASVLAGLGSFQLARGGGMGAVNENLWAAFGSYRILNRPIVSLAFAGLGVLALIRGDWLGSGTSLIYNALLAHDMAQRERKEAGSVAKRAGGVGASLTKKTA